MSYQLKIDPKSRKSARFISRLQKVIQKALIESGKTQQEVAEVLGVDRSVVNRRLKGSANLTARSIAEFAYALDKDVSIEFLDKKVSEKTNWTISKEKLINVQVECARSAPKGTISPNQKFNLERIAS
ncbi:hypothetical protein DSM110093_02356 [Sulfitobacter sp. DSM 110093]|uniref:helix-turn-helix domain-containing protein n=1 Tax=Sulfitobacter sp. DSM 110093 TaxID=2883127 RepID=UPI001FAE08FC|nr:helix-turn-helix transcriptional regulator [Sulfitobacter sp. DSM 110093]UOA32556.1 hypothetical protein DSM110093_02356 [Sulfitobacter sp. DSM 110093]